VLVYPCGCTEILGPIAPVWLGTGRHESADREVLYEEHAKICYKNEHL